MTLFTIIYIAIATGIAIICVLGYVVCGIVLHINEHEGEDWE